MTAEKFEVNTEHLTAGGDFCRYAADSAREAAEQLAGADVASGIFGDFAEAPQFHGTLSTVHRQHQDQLHGHHTTLRAVSAQAVRAAQVFTATDESAADGIDSAGKQFE
ncbi:DUF2563 family protein [Mycobacterium shimoidei]|uniref:DUF2563 family protein n=1 Tax=Mycobacterium shimoidei TaxID=29313 RepID=UPI00084968E5|nr:DUF2563 family protein [Mycobacterium shimoidei]MCV7257789.1 DUF2563 family protein [Mycobacterium shimoidei]ODR14247.1 hypothetical protein BHQ16_07450 [Mycobacterium shimoidei]ORW83855.1 hypothetical protein AWC26_00020 [Mycobacterium shimoidei]